MTILATFSLQFHLHHFHPSALQFLYLFRHTHFIQKPLSQFVVLSGLSQHQAMRSVRIARQVFVLCGKYIEHRHHHQKRGALSLLIAAFYDTAVGLKAVVLVVHHFLKFLLHHVRTRHPFQSAGKG